MIGYRVSAYDTPCPPSPSRRTGRWGVAAGEVVNYWSMHPYAAWAEMYRFDGIDQGSVRTISQRLWIGRFDHLDVVDLTGPAAADWGLRPDDLVDDDWSACHLAAGRLTAAGVSGIRAPSAALPGADNLVLFGQRIAIEFDAVVDDPEIEIPCVVAADATCGVPDALRGMRRQSEPWTARERVDQRLPTPLLQ